MKRFLTICICFLLTFTCITASAVTLEVDGKKLDSPMIFKDSTAFVPLSAMAKLLNKRIDTDKNTNSVFVNGINLFAKKGEAVSIYIDGKKYDMPSSDMQSVVQNGEVYLPAHILADAFGKTPVWYSETASLVLTDADNSSAISSPDEKTTYVIINKANKKALTVTPDGLTLTKFTNEKNQHFTFIPTEYDGYYHIRSAENGNNLDVYAHGVSAGVQIITWEQGEGDNQKFTLTPLTDGTLISARSCLLPIEPYKDTIVQNTRNDLSDAQKWIIAPFDEYSAERKKPEKLIISYTPPADKDEDVPAPYRTFTLGGNALSDTGSLTAALSDGSDAQKWELNEYSKDVYIITNLSTGKSLDVSARSLEDGGAVITWQTNSDANQRWILEQNGDGTYYIKSAYSSLYLTLKEDGSLIQSAKNPALKQRWDVKGVK